MQILNNNYRNPDWQPNPKVKNRALSKYYAQCHDKWFQDYLWLFKSEIRALQAVVPSSGCGMEINLGTGHYAQQLDISGGTESSREFRIEAIKKGLAVVNAKANQLPFNDGRFDYVLIASLCQIQEPLSVVNEIRRVVKPGGTLILGFSNRRSLCFPVYHQKRFKYMPCVHNDMHEFDAVADLIQKSGFTIETTVQTLTDPEHYGTVSPLLPGHNEGAYIVLKCKTTKLSKLKTVDFQK